MDVSVQNITNYSGSFSGSGSNIPENEEKNLHFGYIIILCLIGIWYLTIIYNVCFKNLCKKRKIIIQIKPLEETIEIVDSRNIKKFKIIHSVQNNTICSICFEIIKKMKI
jgi:hypothetical protein